MRFSPLIVAICLLASSVSGRAQTPTPEAEPAVEPSAADPEAAEPDAAAPSAPEETPVAPETDGSASAAEGDPTESPPAVDPDAAAATPAAPPPPEREPDRVATASAPAPEGSELPPEMRRQAFDDTEPVRTEPVAVHQPWRLVGRLGVGGTLRMVVHDELQQERLAPTYLDLTGAVVLPSVAPLRHSILVSAAANLGPDGSFLTGVDPFHQWVFGVGYGLHVPFGRPGAPTWLVGGHVAGSVVASPDTTWGAELGIDGAYHFLAGVGAYVELTASTFFGAEDRAGDLMVNPLLSLEVGLTWDYEVLR